MVTEDFGYTGTKYFLCGVAYTDAVKDDNFYTPGEGLQNISITATRVSDGQVFSTVTWNAGAYRLQLDAGTYNVVGTGTGREALGTVHGEIVEPFPAGMRLRM
jgi:hypothetical protein